MYEGNNQIMFSIETANKFISKFMTELFNSPIKVTDIEKDYKGLTIDFTKDDEPSENAKPLKKVDDETLEEITEDI